MARSSRSLRASAAGLEVANKAFKLKGWTQEYLAGAVGRTRQTIINFFARRPVDKGIFQAICAELGLEWGEIAELETGDEKPTTPTTIDDLVNQVRKKVSADIQKRCGWMRVLDMTKPIGLNDIYTDVNILEKITGRVRMEIAQLLENYFPEDFERFGLNPIEKRVPGLKAVEQHSKLMILGKPGAGKTTFLKRIAIQCKNGHFFADHVPIFITLKDFAETSKQPGLLEYIDNQFALNDISDQEISKTLLRQGRAIVLLDGLDEVRQADNDRVFKEIREFSTQYDANYFVITCRIAAKEYTFEHFTEVEVADFDNKQIEEFGTKWFQPKNPNKAKNFIQKLEENQRIKALATNPLLLTLLCLLFEQSTDFPSNRSELYQEGVDVLLKKWDGQRNIERDKVYKKLSYERKEDLLSTIALKTFEEGNYFFKEELAKKYIRDYIKNLPDAKTDQEALLLDSAAVLKSIEAQHGLLVERARGIYSFSHLTFHEFFTARNIALSRNPQQAFRQLVSHITDKRWREVFLLTVGKLNNADDLLQFMKQGIDKLLARDETLQNFLSWVFLKSNSVQPSYKKAAIRAFYFTFARALDLNHDRKRDLARALDLKFAHDLARDLARNLNPDHDLNLARDLALDLNLDLDLALARDLAHDLDLDLDLDLALNHVRARTKTLDLEHARNLNRARDRDLARARTKAYELIRTLDFDLTRACDLARNTNLQRQIQELKQELPNLERKDLEEIKHWWQTNSQAWTEQLRNVIIQHRNIGHDWQFSNSQWRLLQQYYDANKFLVDCLNSECYVSRSVRQQIEDTLLLPVNFTISLSFN